MKTYIVWNGDKSQGFATKDQQLAYEVRKSSDTNCCDENGRRINAAVEFCNRWAHDNCTTQVVEDVDLESVRQLRLYHWHLALRHRAAQQELEALATRRKSGSLKNCIKTYKDTADLHLTAVQTLNQFFPIGDTAEKDNA